MEVGYWTYKDANVSCHSYPCVLLCFHRRPRSVYLGEMPNLSLSRGWCNLQKELFGVGCRRSHRNLGWWLWTNDNCVSQMEPSQASWYFGNNVQAQNSMRKDRAGICLQDSKMCEPNGKESLSV